MNRWQKLLSLGLGLYVALLPWQTRVMLMHPRLGVDQTEYGSLSIYATDFLLVIVVLGAWLFTKPKKISSHVGYALLALFIVCFGSALFANRSEVVLASLRLLIGGAALWWLAQQEWADRKFILGCFLGGAVLQALFGIGQFFAQYSPASSLLGLASHDPATVGTSVVEAAGQRWLRAYGSLPHPNILGGYLSIALLTAFGFYLHAYDAVRQGFSKWTRENVRRHVEGKRWYWHQAGKISGLILIQAILVVGLLLTFSRSAWVGFLAGWGIVLVVMYFKKWPWGWQLWAKWTFFLGVVATFVVLAVPQAFTIRSSADSRLEQQSISTRQQQYRDAYRLIKLEPLRGVGYGNMVVAIHDRLSMARNSVHDYQPVHNIYLLSVVELGFIGGFVFLAACLFALRSALLGTVVSGRWWNVVGLSGLVCILIIGLLDHYFWTLAFGVSLFWFVIALGSKEE